MTALPRLGYWSLIAALCAASYLLGRADGRSSIINKQIEAGNHVQRQTAEIYARPNARRDALLELMRRNQL